MPGRVESGSCDIGELLERRLLVPVFQPIVDFRARAFLGYEALIRGPRESVLEMPAALFAAAREAGVARELEHAARETSLRAFAASRLPGCLFVNATPGSLFDDEWHDGGTQRMLADLGIAENRIVVELTENERISLLPSIADVLRQLRGRGMRIAIDDLGEGFANLRMWSEVRPEFVKIDRHFVDGIADDPMKHHFVRAMKDLAECCNATLIAEGIERADDFECIRTMGILCGQGYFIARPSTAPETTVPAAIAARLRDARGVLALHRAPAMASVRTVRELLRPVLPVPVEASNAEVLARFGDDPSLDVLPVVDGPQPVGLIDRRELLARLSAASDRVLFGERRCSLVMNSMPLVVDQQATVQELAMMLVAAPRRFLLDGFIVTGGGTYLGIGSSQDLIATITEMQISAARYANPLTRLPGNVPVIERIDRLLAERASFVAACVDIDSFKPFNDSFGYRRGDDVILLLANLLADETDERFDFVGHFGGDDFFVIFQSADWEQRCLSLLDRFAQQIATMAGSTDLPLGSYLAENRRGQIVAQILPRLSIGVVRVEAACYESHREVVAAASDAKKQAKKEAKRGNPPTSGSLFIERRCASASVSALPPPRYAS